jgi:16S rRNA (cytosine967-C5)-methyltransferase
VSVDNRGFHKSRATPARRLALTVTKQIRERNAYAHPLINTQVRTADIPQEERDFAILLILGVVATSGELDLLINRVLTHGNLQPSVGDALRISVYELLFLQREPHAAVDQGVELVRCLSPKAVAFANKVLREVAKLREDFPFGDSHTDIAALAHEQAFPLWLAKRLVADAGFEAAAAFMAASNTQAPVFLANLAQGTTVQIAPPELPAWLPRVEASEMLIADASVQKVVELALCDRPDRPFLEVGSGRGTKTVLLQRAFLRAQGRQPSLYALDLHAFKNDILRERIKRYHLEHVTPVTGDATQLSTLVAQGKLPESFGGALIDAPCSGTGTLRRHPEIRWRLTPMMIMAMATQGLKMLKAVARHIEVDGSLTYSTCSVLREENEQIIEAFLASEEGEGFVLQPPASFHQTLAPASPDAHFAARLMRRKN